MNDYFGTELFWITAALLFAIIFIINMVGGLMCRLFPLKLKINNQQEYLAPLVGLTSLVLFSSYLGKIFSMGKGSFVSIVSILILGLIFVFETEKKKLFRSTFIVAGFGFICGLSILVPLFLYGAFNSHNDAFTYLAHSDWLQRNAFNNIIADKDIEPLTTQVALYQRHGLRMGGSFLLAFFQGLFGLNWAYDIYPAVVISIITSGCYAIGFLLSGLFAIRKKILLFIVAFPALNLGGLVFAANLGFFPQTLGVIISFGLLILFGQFFYERNEHSFSRKQLLNFSFICALFSAGLVFSYSELAPFVFIALVLSVVFNLLLNIKSNNLGFFLLSTIVLSLILINTEGIRFYEAIKTQSAAIVGTPVDWPVFGFFVHALGFHGGAWDLYQWTRGNDSLGAIFIGMCLTVFSVLIIINSRALIKKNFLNSRLMPVINLLAIFLLFFLYFRYFTSSPFSVGVGQSWSQFKLANWSSFYLMFLFLFSLCGLYDEGKKNFTFLVFGLFIIGLISTISISILRINPLLSNYAQTKNLRELFVNFNKKIKDACSNEKEVYLNFNERDQKIKQMLLLYLDKRTVASDWTGDGYIATHLPTIKNKKLPKIGDCVVEFYAKKDLLGKDQGENIEVFRVGDFRESPRVHITEIIGAYEQETDGVDTWNWVEEEVHFKVDPALFLPNMHKVKIFFEYATVKNQNLLLKFVFSDAPEKLILLKGEKNISTRFERIIDFQTEKLEEVIVVAGDKAINLSENDPRKANFMVKNFYLEQAR